ncbi:Zona pellucida sperm-binding protein 3 receptor [Bienertia sinuspersici]
MLNVLNLTSSYDTCNRRVSTITLSSSPIVVTVSMLDVMNPSEVLGHHAGRAYTNTFRLSLDRGVSTITLSSSPTVAMGQRAGRDEPIGGVSTIMLSSSPTVAMGQHAGHDEPIGGVRHLLTVRPSLLRPGSRAESLVDTKNFRKNMSTMVKLDNMDAYVLHNMMPDRDTTNDKPPLLGRSIVSAYWKIIQRPESKKGVFAGQWVDFWCKRSILYSAPVKRKRYTDAPPKSTHNPSGKLEDPPLEWSTKELHLFNSLGIEVEGRKETTYVAAFLSCWLCVFVLLQNEERLIRPGTFEITLLMARGETFSLPIPVLARIYRGLNVISRSPNPSYSGADFAAHYLYGWLALYFSTNHAVDPSPPGPLMGSGAKDGCTMLNKNKNILLFDDDNLDHIQMSYLSSLRSGYVCLRNYDSFFIELYLPYRFSWQFGFCQDIPSAITHKVQDPSNVSYDKVLMFWKLLLFQGSMSRVCAPCPSLDWHKLKTVKFHDWWTMVIIKDLRHNIDKLCSTVESSSSNHKRVSLHDEARDAHRSADGHASQYEGTGDNVCAAPPKRLHLIGAMDGVEGEDKSASDAESEINFENQRGRRSKKPRTTNLEGDEIDFGNAFDNIPIPSDIPIDLTKFYYFEMGAPFNIDDAMIEEAIEPLNKLTNKTIPRKSKDIHIERDLVERSNAASLTHTHHSIDGPFMFEINAKTLAIPLDANGISRAPSHGDAVPAPSISTIRVTTSSQGIFTSAIRILGHEYLTLLKQTPFNKVSDRHREASQVYKAIRVIHGNPEPLKCKVDEYVWAVKGHLALKESLSDRRRSVQVEEERLAVVEELKLVESSYDTALTKHKGLEIFDYSRSSVHATKRRVEELEAVPACCAEEMELFEEKERKLLEFQSSLDNSEWIV